MIEHFNTARRQIRRSPYQALSAVLIMALTFFVATVLAILAYGSNATLKYFETQPQIIAFLKNEATPDQVSALQRELQADPRIKDVKYVTKEQALGIYKQATADKPVLSQLVSPSVFPASLEFSVSDLQFAQDVIKETQAKDTVSQVAFTASVGGVDSIETVINNLKKITSYVRIGGSVLLSFLVASSLLILLVILGMRIASRREEIEILQLIGATSGFIRMPFIFEAIIYSLAGAFFGWLLATLMLLYTIPSIKLYFNTIPVFPDGLQGLGMLFGGILGAELVMAIFLGFVGSFIALRRYLKI